MSFFLLGKHPDGRLSLLSENSFPTRQDAMGELSDLTASPRFDAWDAEVFVVDSDSGTPVLLVRPTPPDADMPAIEPENQDAADPALTAVMLDLGVADEAPGAESAPEPEIDSDESADSVEPTSDETPAQSADTEQVAVDVFVAESEPLAEVVDAAWATAVEETSAGEGLKGALQRTAAKMEADGISAPDSVGPAAAAGLLGEVVAPRGVTEQPDSPEPVHEAPIEQEPTAGEMPDAEAEQVVEPVSMPAGEAAEATMLDVDDVETDEALSEPADEAGNGQEGLDREDTATGEAPADETHPTAETPTVDEGPTDGGGWPWDIAADPDSAPPLAALDEPGEDSESMIRAMADDDASRTVVLGEYAIDDVKGSEPFLDAAKRAAADESAAEQEPERQPEIVADAQTYEQPAEPAQRETDDEVAAVPADAPVESDFVDLGEVTPAPPAKVYEPGDIDMDGMTCDDCVYVDTCPNKDEREPVNCGSFQWK